MGLIQPTRLSASFFFWDQALRFDTKSPCPQNAASFPRIDEHLRHDVTCRYDKMNVISCFEQNRSAQASIYRHQSSPHAVPHYSSLSSECNPA
jgi:hypothetical protein